MRVMHVVTAFGLGGAERVALDLATAQVRQGAEPIIVAVKKPHSGEELYTREFEETGKRLGIALYDVAGRDLRWSVPVVALRVNNLIGGLKPDIVHTHGDPAEAIVTLVSAMRRLNVVRSLHNLHFWPDHLAFVPIAEIALEKASVVAVSSAALDAFDAHRTALRMKSAPFRNVIENGVPIPETAAQPSTDALRFGFFGRWTAQKGLDILLDAVRHLGERGREIPIDISSDIDEPTLNAFLREFSSTQVRFHRPHPNARSAMADYDIILMPSRFEGFPLVALEAMSLGVPILAATAPGLVNVMPADWPLKVPPENPAALADMILKVIAGGFDLAPLRQKARQHAAIYSIERTADRYLEVYQTHLARRKKAA